MELKAGSRKAELGYNASRTYDVEEGSSNRTNNGSKEQLKRNLGARHINMIAIAGMIVSAPHYEAFSPL